MEYKFLYIGNGRIILIQNFNSINIGIYSNHNKFNECSGISFYKYYK